jgi:hypothetical protein
LCQKPIKEKTPLEKRQIYNYVKGQVNFFKDLEREKLEMLVPQIAAREYDQDEISNDIAVRF